MNPPSAAQARLIWWALSGLALATLVGLVVGIIWGLGQALNLLTPVIWPLALAGVLAYLLDPVVDFIVQKGIARARAIALVFLLAVGFCAGVIGSIVPQIYREAQQFGERVPAYTQKLQQRLEGWATNPPVFVRKALTLRRIFGTNDVAPPLSPATAGGTTTPVSATTSSTGTERANNAAVTQDIVRSATSWVTGALPAAGGWLLDRLSRVSSWFGLLTGAFLVPVYLFYFLLEKRGIERQWTEYLPVRQSEFKDELVFCLRAINGYLFVFFRSQVLVALCDGALYTLGFLIIGLPYSFLLGLMSTVLTMIPFLGAMATCVTALLIAFAATGSWELPALVLGVFAIVQSIEGLVISPKIMGDRVGLHPLTIIIAVMAGTTLLGGVLGGVLAIPLTAALRVIMFRYIWRKPTGTEETAPANGSTI